MLKALTVLVALFSLSASDLDQITLRDAGVVRVEYVDGKRWSFRKNEYARAFRTRNGERWIIIDLNADHGDMHGWFLHEMAHHIAWNRYGEGIDPHGKEFRRICRKLVKTRPNYFCKGE